MKTPLRLIATGVLVLGLAACSEGGKGDGPGGAPSVPVQAAPGIDALVGDWKFVPTGALEFIVYTVQPDGSVASRHSEATPDFTGTVTANPDGTYSFNVTDGETTLDYRLEHAGRSEALTAFDQNGKEAGTFTRE